MRNGVSFHAEVLATGVKILLVDQMACGGSSRAGDLRYGARSDQRARLAELAREERVER